MVASRARGDFLYRLHIERSEDRRGGHWTDSDVLLVYAPGGSPDEWPANMAKFIPSGPDLVFQMHYTTNGQAASDQTSIGLIFSKRAPEKRVLTLQLTNDHFVIPPGDSDFRVEARGTLPNDATLLSFMPHMHLRENASNTTSFTGTRIRTASRHTKSSRCYASTTIFTGK